MTGFLAKAQAAWNGAPPPFVQRLAQEADAAGLAGAGRAIGYGKAAVSLVLSNRYGAGLGKVEAAVLSHLGATFECPVLGDIDDTRCRTERATAERSRNLWAGMLRNACRACPRREA